MLTTSQCSQERYLGALGEGASCALVTACCSFACRADRAVGGGPGGHAGRGRCALTGLRHLLWLGWHAEWEAAEGPRLASLPYYAASAKNAPGSPSHRIHQHQCVGACSSSSRCSSSGGWRWRLALSCIQGKAGLPCSAHPISMPLCRKPRGGARAGKTRQWSSALLSPPHPRL